MDIERGAGLELGAQGLRRVLAHTLGWHAALRDLGAAEQRMHGARPEHDRAARADRIRPTQHLLLYMSRRITGKDLRRRRAHAFGDAHRQVGNVDGPAYLLERAGRLEAQRPRRPGLDLDLDLAAAARVVAAADEPDRGLEAHAPEERQKHEPEVIERRRRPDVRAAAQTQRDLPPAADCDRQTGLEHKRYRTGGADIEADRSAAPPPGTKGDFPGAHGKPLDLGPAKLGDRLDGRQMLRRKPGRRAARADVEQADRPAGERCGRAGGAQQLAAALAVGTVYR